MLPNSTYQPKHHRSINIMKSIGDFHEFSSPSHQNEYSPIFEIIPEEELTHMMHSIQIKNTQRQLSQHDQKYSVRKKLLNLYEQSKKPKPQIKQLRIPLSKSKANKEKLFVPVLSSRRNNKSPFMNPRITQFSDTSNKSGNSNGESLSLTPLSSKRVKYEEYNYLV